MFRGRVLKKQSIMYPGIDCLKKIINLISQKAVHFSDAVLKILSDPLTNLVNLLNFLNEIKLLDEICINEASLAIQSCIFVITKNYYNKRFFEQN